MLKFPDLVSTSTPGALPLLDIMSYAEAGKVVFRTGPSIMAWRRGSDSARNVPQYISAYMQLITGTHPQYAMHWVCAKINAYPATDPRPNAGVARARPPAEVREWEQAVADWRVEFGVTDDDVRGAFGYPEVSSAGKRESVKAIGNDPVRWFMLRLMAGDRRIRATVGRHAPERSGDNTVPIRDNPELGVDRAQRAALNMADPASRDAVVTYAIKAAPAVAVSPAQPD